MKVSEHIPCECQEFYECLLCPEKGKTVWLPLPKASNGTLSIQGIYYCLLKEGKGESTLIMSLSHVLGFLPR